MIKKITIKECQELAQSKGGKCLSNNYINSNVYMDWECEKGHIWSARFSSIKNSHSWCPDCSGKRKLTIEYCKNFAINNEIVCLSDFYKNSSSNLKWKCAEGHIWLESISSIKLRDKLCRCCSGAKITIKTCQEFALSKSGKCLSDNYINSLAKMKWECSQSHVWEAPFNRIKNEGAWCPDCAGNRKITINECQEFALKNNGKCLSKKYTNCLSKMKWECAEGHIWETTFSSIKNCKTWCPKCNINKSEHIAREFFEFVFQKEFIKIRPDWLKNDKNYKLELDGYCAELNMAFEFQGIQHYKPFYGEVSFINLKKNDLYKKNICNERGLKLIYLDGRKCTTYNNLYKHVRKVLRKLCKNSNVLNIYYDRIDLFDVKKVNINYKSQLIEIKNIALEKGDICVSNIYIDSHFHLDFICKNEHEFKMTPANYKSGYGCTFCYGNAKLTLKDAQNLAESKNGKCLSKKYINSISKMDWECSEGHVWSTTYSAIVAGWCPFCAKKVKHTIEQVKEIALSKNIKCIDDIFINNITFMNFECMNGHSFKTQFSYIKHSFKECIECKKEKTATRNEIKKQNKIKDKIKVNK